MVVDRNEGPLADEVLVRLFREIMSACLAQQEPLKVGYLGPEGTFSEQAMRKHFGHSAHGLPLASIEEVFQEVENGNADFGVVPVENSGEGTIQITLDMFLSSALKICGEVELRVRQFLLSRTGRIEDIERVYSHPQSFAQCRGWLRTHLPKVEKVPVSSNAEAARRARNADDAAAIAGESAAHIYGLRKVIMSPIATTTPRASSSSGGSSSPRPDTIAPRCWCSSRTSRARCSTCSVRSRVTASA